LKSIGHIYLKAQLTGLILFSLSLSIRAGQVIFLNDSMQEVNISNEIYYVKDPRSVVTWEEIRSGKYDSDWIKNNGASLSFGNLKATIWHKFSVSYAAASRSSWILIADNHHLDTLTLYTPTHKGSYLQETSGRLIPYQDRKYKFNTFAFELPVPSLDTQVFYLKVSSYMLNYPVRMIRYDRFVELQMSRSITMGVLVGFLLMIVLYNLFIYSSERDKNYLFYIIYVFISIIKITDMKGYMDIFYQGPFSFMRSQTPGITPFLGLAMILFTIHILDFRKNLPRANKWLLVVFGPMMIMALFFDLINMKLYSSVINQIGTIAVTIFLYVCAILIYRKGYKPARYYIIAVSAFFLSICIYTLCLFGVIPLNNITDNLIEFGSGLEMMLFSLALADKIRTYKQAKNQAEHDLLKTLQKNEELILNQNKLLEIKVRERTKDLNDEKEKSDNLLLNILPSEIAEELKNNGQSQARMYDHTSVLFTDFVNFTGISEQFSPSELVHEINHCFTAFDNIVGNIGLEKIKTIGDAYLAVCGLPLVESDHAFKTIRAALEIRDFIESHLKEGGRFEIRIGIHSGPLVAGIIGVKKFAYDIWGDTVNTAARMEQNSVAGKINISGATYELIKDKAICTYRGKIAVKNKGEIDMYFVERLK
jgi:class 3 adenylate cyclase